MNKQKLKRRPARRTRAGAYTVAQIDKMKRPQLMAAVRILAVEYERAPSPELETIIQYMMGRLE